MSKSSAEFTRNCRNWGRRVRFSDSIRAENGSRVPLEKDGSRHVCTVSTSEEARIARAVQYIVCVNAELKHAKLSLIMEDLVD